MLTLAFDTSSKTSSVAVLDNDKILYDVINHTGMNHSETLLPAIEQACLNVGLQIKDFDLFVCTIGPGSFTGLRIGLGTLKGFVLATGKPAVGVSSLAALAMNADLPSPLICPLMDAGRGQIYSAYFRYMRNGRIRRLTSDRVACPHQIVEEVKEGTTFIGEGAVLYSNILKKTKNKKCIIALPHHQFIRASSAGILGVQKYHANELLDIAKCSSLYLRSEDVVIKKKD